jgi:hypothetical protein
VKKKDLLEKSGYSLAKLQVQFSFTVEGPPRRSLDKLHSTELGATRDNSPGVPATPKITYLKLLIEVNTMSLSIHISIFYDLCPYIISHNSQFGIHYWHTQTQILNEIDVWMGKNRLRLIINFGR